MTPNPLDRAVLDFAAGYAAGPAAAVGRAERVLHDPDALSAHLAVLHGLADGVARLGHAVQREPVEEFDPVIAEIGRVGLCDALLTGHVSPERVGQLLTHPDAVRAVHRRLAGGDRPPVGLTDIWWAGREDLFCDKLRPWLRLYLSDSGLSDTDVDPALDYILEQLTELRPGERVGERLPGLVRGYADRVGRRAKSVPLDLDWVRRAAVRETLRDATPGEFAVYQAVRERARQLDLRRPEDFLDDSFIRQFDHNRRLVSGFCGNLYVAAETRARDGEAVLLN